MCQCPSRKRDELIAVFSNYNVASIFRSQDGGASFEPIGGNLEQFENGTGDGPSLRWGVFVPLDDGTTRLYVGTSSGLYSTNDIDGNDTEWVREGANSIAKSIVTMIKYRPLDGRMVVATHGNGVFATQIANHKLITPPTQTPGPFEVTAAYPNPFNKTITVEYTLPEDAIVLARVFDLNGNWVNTALWGTQLAGTNHISWNGTNNRGRPVPEGIYVLSLLFNGKTTSTKIILSR